jgi:hypothetical protein
MASEPEELASSRRAIGLTMLTGLVLVVASAWGAFGTSWNGNMGRLHFFTGLAKFGALLFGGGLVWYVAIRIRARR